MHDAPSAPTRPGRAPSLRDRVLRLAERATTPLLPADYLDLFDPLRSGADLRGRIVEVHPETRGRRHHRDPPGRGLGRPRARASTSASASTSTASASGAPTP